VVMYLRPTRLRFIRGLRPPLSWLGAWLGGKYLVDSIIAMGGFSYVLRGRDELNRKRIIYRYLSIRLSSSVS